MQRVKTVIVEYVYLSKVETVLFKPSVHISHCQSPTQATLCQPVLTLSLYFPSSQQVVCVWLEN